MVYVHVYIQKNTTKSQAFSVISLTVKFKYSSVSTFIKYHTKILSHLPKNYQIQRALKSYYLLKTIKNKNKNNGGKLIFYAQEGASRERLTAHNYNTFPTLPLDKMR